MTIQCENLGKKFKNEWIFKNFTHTFETGKIYAITGPNGSGKSTLLQVITGFIPQNIGTCHYVQNNHIIDPDQTYKHVSISSPFLELIEDYTLEELIDFQQSVGKLQGQKSDIITALGLQKHSQKYIKHYSSGMKQKVKLGLSLASGAQVILLDEPTTNFDETAKTWYQAQIQSNFQQKIIIIASNDATEYNLAHEKIDILQYK